LCRVERNAGKATRWAFGDELSNVRGHVSPSATTIFQDADGGVNARVACEAAVRLGDVSESLRRNFIAHT
jgi:hypothetical protein